MEAQTIDTQAALAKALRVHRSAVTRYLRRPDFPCKLSPPWDATDVEEIRQWQATELQPDRSGRGRQEDTHPFYRNYSYRGNWRVRVAMRDDEPSTVAAAPLAQPVEVCTPAERAVLEGKATLTPEQVREVVGKMVRFKAMMAQLCESLPPWLEGEEAEEMRRRMRAAVYEKLAWHELAMKRATGGADDE